MDTEIFQPEHLEAVKQMPHLKSEDIADAVVYVLGTPPHVQVKIVKFVDADFVPLRRLITLKVHELTIKPVGETF